MIDQILHLDIDIHYPLIDIPDEYKTRDMCEKAFEEDAYDFFGYS